MNDVELAGIPYTVVPGGYSKGRRKPLSVSRPAARKTRRVELGPFAGGLGQARVEGDVATAGWEGLTVGPAFAGMGVEPFPNVSEPVHNMVEVVTTTKRAYGAIAANAAYIGVGQRIYKSVALDNGTWADFVVANDLGAGFAISGLTYYKDDLLILFSSGQDIRKLNTTTNAVSVWRVGEKAVVGVGYAGQLIYAPRAANNEDELRLSGTKWNGNAVTHLRYLDSPILRMCLFNGKVAIATRKSLYFMGGQPYPGEADDAAVTADTSKAPLWIGEPEPVMSHGLYAEGDDFVFLESYRGRLYTWLGSQVAQFDDSTEEANWQRMGPEGTRCYGACVAGDWLIVSIVARYGGSSQLWGFDGAGWWLFYDDGVSFWPAVWPCPLTGAGNRDFVAFRSGGGTHPLFRLKWRSTTVHTYAAGGRWTSPLIDGGDPSEDKVITAMGAVFASPSDRGNIASVDGVTFPLEYSVDGGATWTVAVSQSASSGATRVFTRETTFDPPLQGRVFQIRQSWSSVSDWAPVLTKVWVEYEGLADYTFAELQQSAYEQALLDEDVRRRRWEITIGASDRAPRRDGQVSALTGRQLITALWDAWESGAPLSFKDIDNDTDPVSYTVEIVDIAEKAPKPADSGRWGESVVALVLEESATGQTPIVAGVYGAGTLVIDAGGGVTLPTIPSVAKAIEARVDTYEAAASDSLVSIARTGVLANGTLLILRTLDSGRDVIVTDAGAGAVGALRLTGDANYTLATTANGILLEQTAPDVWTERGRW